MSEQFSEQSIVSAFLRQNRTEILNVPKINPLAPNDVYISCTAQLTSRCCILNIYPTNTLTKYFKCVAHSPFFLYKMPFIS